ncbi:hypothetical protein AX15_002843 [Amanita polypyramis BW_CC]|nr:hypothetical protein AX15_002843 [Amanita polypyramis BW_CC]
MMYSGYQLLLGEKGARVFTVPSPGAGQSVSNRPRRMYKVKVTKVDEINSEVLNQHVKRKQALDRHVSTVIMALNVANRMKPSLEYPSNSKSFFIPSLREKISSGFELWRGFFQSLRPGIGRVLLNVDMTTGLMFRPGPLIDLCREFIGIEKGPFDPRALSPPGGLTDAKRIRLQRFVFGIKVAIRTPSKELRTASIKGISRVGANQLRFKTSEGRENTVANYFRQEHNVPPQYPQIFCIELGSGAMYPAEFCTVLEGQLARRQVPPDKVDAIVKFSSAMPARRFEQIRQGATQILSLGQSNYVQQFGMKINTAKGLLNIKARILPSTHIQYGRGTQPQPKTEPKDGAWNLVGKRFYEPKTIRRWVVVVYDSRFGDQQINDLIAGIVQGSKSLGMTIMEERPIVKKFNGQGDIAAQLNNACHECRTKGEDPNLIFVVLPVNGDDIYKKVKHFGDITTGITTQCVKSRTANRAKAQYYANVLAKVNVKLGGRNHVLDPDSVALLKDLQDPVIVLGADVMHPGPGSVGRPSYAAVVGSIDSLASRYVSAMRVQSSRVELIEDLENMVKDVLGLHYKYKTNVEKSKISPKRLIFYRDGVSTGQFKQVVDEELPLIKRACQSLRINPKITLIIVGKRHHFRFMSSQNEKGHTPAGLIVDTDITDPILWDWYGQSHKPLIGTSRPAHYTVVHDENDFNSDILQCFSNALCYVYARSTSAVSIPAPVYYADRICARAPIHYAPNADSSATSEVTPMENLSEDKIFKWYKERFKSVNSKHHATMYFM